MKIKSTLLAAGLALGGSAAHAALVSHSTSFAAQPTPFSTSFLVPQFDSSLGTLNGIMLTLATHIVGEINVYNLGATARPFTNAYAQIPVTVTTPGGASITVTTTATRATGSAAPGLNTYSGIDSSASTLLSLVPADFAPYLGNGSSTLLFSLASGDGTYGGTSAPGLLFGGAALVDGVFSVGYDYDPVAAVPVPAAAWLLGSGLLSLGAACRRRRA